MVNRVSVKLTAPPCPRTYFDFFPAPSTMAVRLWPLAALTLMNRPVMALRPMPGAFFAAVLFAVLEAAGFFAAVFFPVAFFMVVG